MFKALFLLLLADIPEAQLKLFAPLPAAEKQDPALVDLGRRLFSEPRLSRNGRVSCDTCHPLARGGADGQPTSPGVEGRRGPRNSPTVFNAALHFAQFWDGRAATLEAQAAGPLLNPVEMGLANEQAVVEILQKIPAYPPLFAKAFPKEKQPVSFTNLTRALAAFERTLLTPARWDRFLQGDHSALSDAEKQGLNQFLAAGCAFCHRGPLLGGSSFQKLGLSKPYPRLLDPGRSAITHRLADRGFFKVPTLRNVARTAPYLHDGSIASLDATIQLMAEYQIGTKLTPAEAASIRVFLAALNADPPKQ